MDNLNTGLATFEQFQINHHYSAEKNMRRRILIEKTSEWELVLLVWGPKSQTAIHDHNGSKCWTRILSGQLVELAYENSEPILKKSLVLRAGDASYIDDSLGSHSIVNFEDTIALSLHLYATPIEFSHHYDQQRNIWIREKVNSEIIQESEFYEKSFAP
jgi:cysteine dioxygenase